MQIYTHLDRIHKVKAVGRLDEFFEENKKAK
jgi:hypothetical protein